MLEIAPLNQHKSRWRPDPRPKTTDMFGKLTIDALPFYSGLTMSGALLTMFGAFGAAALITWFGQWRCLWTEWLTSLDHKDIGIMYVTLALIMLVRGFIDAMMMRTQQAIALNSDGYLPPGHFDQIFTSHATIMVFFVAMPFLVGLINVVVPQQIGARNVAFPFMNSASLWLTVSGATLVMISLFIGKFSTAGWSAYPPHSEAQFSPGVGVDYWIWAILVSGVGSMLTGINFVVTIVKRRAPGMRLMMMPLFTWTALCTSILIVFAFPALTVAAALLGLDRSLGMHFFTDNEGGKIYVNLFWIWGHPAVYILILPASGIYSEIVATFSGKRLFGYESLVYATAAITVLSLGVWLHHFFTMGANSDVNAFFGRMAPLIAVPTGVMIFSWLSTIYLGRVKFSVPMLFTLGFIVTFVIGGMAGVLLAIAPPAYPMHNTTFLVAHFHNIMIPGALFGYLAGYQYWFPKAFGFRLEERWGRRAFWAWIVGFYLAFIPLYILGYMGMPQQLDRYYVARWQPYLIVAELGALFILCGITFLGIQLAVSIRYRAALTASTGDPWNGRTLEWATASPPATYNFAVVPHVHGIDAWWAMKQAGTAGQRLARFQDIVMPDRSSAGVVLGAMSFVLAFAMIWQIWWLAAIGGLGMCAAALSLTFRDHAKHHIPASEIKAIENRRIMVSRNRSRGADIADAVITVDEKAYGFWIYLKSDAILFALLIATFVVMSHNTADGPDGHTLFRLSYAFAETVLLLASSTTLGFANAAIAAGQRWCTPAWLSVTLVFGLGFVAMEILEFYGMVVAGAGPWRSGFLSALFVLVGTYGTHVTVGLVWIVLLGCEAALRGINPFLASRVYRLGLFWHFLDIVWIGIYSVVYLPGIL
jgi:cytochrome o ubiquinol oxidase subunit 1